MQVVGCLTLYLIFLHGIKNGGKNENKENKSIAFTTTHSRLWFEHYKFRISVKQSTPTHTFYENGILRLTEFIKKDEIFSKICDC